MATAEDVDGTDDDGPDGTVVEDDRGRETATTDEDRYTRKKSVLITGCSSGIGRATARAFLAEDWQVFATARNVDDIDDLEEAGCETLALDVTDPEQVASVVEETVDIAGSIDCVVNNAGYAQMGPSRMSPRSTSTGSSTSTSTAPTGSLAPPCRTCAPRERGVSSTSRASSAGYRCPVRVPTPARSTRSRR